MGEPADELQRSFEKLLDQARSGSRDAFQELVEPFQRVVRYRARRRMKRRLGEKISNSDVCQITYLKAFENLNQFRGNTFDEFACWLLGITDHVCQRVQRIYHCQARDVSREVPLYQVEKELVTGEQSATEDKLNGLFEAAWHDLAYRYQLVIRWHNFEKCSHEEVGQRLGLSPDAAKHLHRRAMRKLAEFAQRHEED